MTLTRWKLMAGVLGLSLGGLAAMAESPTKSKTPARKDACPECVPAVPTVAVAAPPVVVPPPAPTGVPQLVAPVSPAPAAIPPSPEPTPLVATPAELPPAPPVPAVMFTSKMTTKDDPKPELAPMPRPVPTKVVEVTVPASVVAVAAAEPIPVPPPAPVPTTPPVRTAEPQPPATTAAYVTESAEKKLKVMLHMGDDRPRFEVADADEVYLKVVSDTVDVKAPTAKTDGPSCLKAAGKVRFVTPGGDGVCDELTVTPGTGQVVVTGKVRFTSRWGRAETEVSGDKMTFRLGATPGVAPAPEAVPTSFTRPSR